MRFFLAVLATVMFIEGLPYFFFPQQTKRLLEEIQELPAGFLRLVGMILLIIALVLAFISKSMK